jgi:hypothetical protein
MIQLIFRFTFLITLLLGITFGIHLLTLNSLSFPLFENKIITSYIINHLLTIGIVVTLLLLKNKFAESLGYIFFIGSFVKFIAFFILINPSLKENGDVSRVEFLSFFIPYAISLIFEVTFLVKTLNKEG